MKELSAILDALSAAEERGEEAVLATVVRVKGSAYRRPGARMLILPDGKREGSISGGCLEGDVSKKAWWLTETGRPALRTYDTTSDEDAVWEFGLGCNGVVDVLLERLGGDSPRESVELLATCRRERRTGVMVTIIRAPDGIDAQTGDRLLLFPSGQMQDTLRDPDLRTALGREAIAAMEERRSSVVQVNTAFGPVEAFVEAIVPPLPLLIFGAGHDAMPLVRLAKELGWNVTLADGRPAYARRERFPLADSVVPTPASAPLDGVSVDPFAVAVVMNHEYAQDRAVLGELRPYNLRYVGVLGPRARTEKMLADLGLTTEDLNLHAPVGLDIGADTPEGIALSIVAEIQASLSGRPGSSLRTRAGSINSRSDETRVIAGEPLVSV